MADPLQEPNPQHTTDPTFEGLSDAESSDNNIVEDGLPHEPLTARELANISTEPETIPISSPARNLESLTAICSVTPDTGPWAIAKAEEAAKQQEPIFPFAANAVYQPAPEQGAPVSSAGWTENDARGLAGQAGQTNQAPTDMPAGMPDGAPGSAPGTPGGASKIGMFEPTEALRNGMLPEDLPYASEVEAALARQPSAGARTLSLAVGAFFLVFLLWASFASLDEVTHAEGQVVGSQRTQVIQNLEGGILRSVEVHEGQIVEKGAVLARLDNEMAESSYRDAVNKSLENLAAIIRLEAELNNTNPAFPDDLLGSLAASVGRSITADVGGQTKQIIHDQQQAFNARYQQKMAELQVLESQFQQKKHEVDEQIARKRQLDRSLQLAIEQRDLAYPLLQRRNFSKVEYLGLQQKVVQLQGDIESLASSIPRSQSAAREAEQRIVFRKAELDSAITDEINKRRLELTSLSETLAAGGDRVTRTELRSPVRGTIKQIYISTVGGVVKPGEAIMEIVPLDDTLLVEARVTPADVAFLRPGQAAMVKLTAYDFSIYGGLQGTLEQISADTFEDKRGNFHYIVKVRTAQTSLGYRGELLPIMPGMMATVDIMIGKKTVLDYILKPILKAKQNALRER